MQDGAASPSDLASPLICLFDLAGAICGNAKPACNIMQKGSHGNVTGACMMSMDDLRRHAKGAPEQLLHGKEWSHWTVFVTGCWLEVCECMVKEKHPTWEQVTSCIGCMIALCCSVKY